MKSHSWLIILTVALCAIVSYANGKLSSLPMADDPLFNKMLDATKDNTIEVDSPAKTKYTGIVDTPVKTKRIPLAEDPR